MTMNFKHYSQQNIDISVPIISEPYKLVVPWPKYESRLFAPIRPFQPLVSCSSIRTIFKGNYNFRMITSFWDRFGYHHTDRTGTRPFSCIWNLS